MKLKLALFTALTLTALAQTPAPPPAHPLGTFDTNGDGTLSDSEKAAALKALEQKHPMLMKVFDKNGDGQIQPSEKAQAAKILQEWKATGATPGP